MTTPAPTFNERPMSAYEAGYLKRTHLSDEITGALSGLSYAQPFFAGYLYDRTTVLCLWPDDEMAGEIPTAATDGKRIYVNAEFFARLDVKERIAVMAHEVCHDMLGHPSRMRTWHDWGHMLTEAARELPYAPSLMNVAMDAEINATLVSCGMKLPAQTVLFNWVKPGEWTVEAIYEKLFDDMPPEAQKAAMDAMNGEGEGEEGDGPGQVMPDHGGMDRHIMPEGTPTAADEEDRKRALKSAVSNGKRAGNVPGHIERMVEELCKPLVDWRDVLRDLIVTVVGQENLDWRRMHRRRYLLIGSIDPARRSERCANIVFIFDTSGSVGPYIRQFMSEVASVAEEMSPRSIKVLWTDTRVAHVDTLDDASSTDVAGLTVHGGGGTDLRTGFEWVEENLLAAGEEVAAVVVLTDSQTPWPSDDPGYPVIVATTCPELQHASWMHVVEIDEKAAQAA
jgi:predicted metal-dependent peptidase